MLPTINLQYSSSCCFLLPDWFKGTAKGSRENSWEAGRLLPTFLLFPPTYSAGWFKDTAEVIGVKQLRGGSNVSPPLSCFLRLCSSCPLPLSSSSLLGLGEKNQFSAVPLYQASVKKLQKKAGKNSSDVVNRFFAFQLLSPILSAVPLNLASLKGLQKTPWLSAVSTDLPSFQNYLGFFSSFPQNPGIFRVHFWLGIWMHTPICPTGFDTWTIEYLYFNPWTVFWLCLLPHIPGACLNPDNEKAKLRAAL